MAQVESTDRIANKILEEPDWGNELFSKLAGMIQARKSKLESELEVLRRFESKLAEVPLPGMDAGVRPAALAISKARGRVPARRASSKRGRRSNFDADALLAVIKKTPDQGRGFYAKKLGLDATKLSPQLARLVEAGKLKSKGDRKTTTYRAG